MGTESLDGFAGVAVRCGRRWLGNTQVSGDVSGWPAMTQASYMCVWQQEQLCAEVLTCLPRPPHEYHWFGPWLLQTLMHAHSSCVGEERVKRVCGD